MRQGVYLWQTPVWGTIARLMSGQNESNIDTFTTLTETDIKFGLFPPVSISVGAIPDGSVEINWDPGLDTHRIDGYHVYWDTDSGAMTPYAFDQLVAAGQTSLVVGGLTPVTTRSRTTLIVPVVARIDRPDELVPDPAEVHSIIEPPIDHLLDESRWLSRDFHGYELWFYEFEEGTLWGATAFMVRELLKYLREEPEPRHETRDLRHET